jgi:hypothetical protein
MTTLLQIAADAQALLDLIDAADPELDAATEAALDAWFQEVEVAEATKLEGYCRLIRTLELRAAARKEESERIAKLVRADENKARALKLRLQFYLEIAGKKRIDTATYRITLAANGGKPPLEIPPNAAELPEQFQRISVSADVDAIREALDRGEAVFGCRLLERGKHVRIA